MDLNHTQFQSLSASEAMDIQRKIGGKILEAYFAGLNVVIQNWENPIGDLIGANHKALIDLGFSPEYAELKIELVNALADQARKDVANHG